MQSHPYGVLESGKLYRMISTVFESSQKNLSLLKVLSSLEQMLRLDAILALRIFQYINEIQNSFNHLLLDLAGSLTIIYAGNGPTHRRLVEFEIFLGLG